MEEFTATFEAESKTDAYAVGRMVERLYDAVREESRTLRGEADGSTEMLERFEAMRDAAREHEAGRLTVTYEQRDDGKE